MSRKEDNLAWMDLEFTGLNSQKEVILEIATLITDQDLNIIAEGPVLAVNQSEKILGGMDEWNKTQHQNSGLLERVMASRETHQTAEKKTLGFISKYCLKQVAPLCGNSIHLDKQFLKKYMPNLHDFFHYRNIDVSTIKELAKRWYPSLPEFPKRKAHLALDDIKESIEELKYYRNSVFLR